MTSSEEGGAAGAGKRSAAARKARADEKEAAKASDGKKQGDDDENGRGGGAVALGGVDVDRTVTGVLASRPTAIDLRIDQFSMQVNGQELVRDCTLELNAGRRYGLLGANGCGKSNLLAALAGTRCRSRRTWTCTTCARRRSPRSAPRCRRWWTTSSAR